MKVSLVCLLLVAVAVASTYGMETDDAPLIERFGQIPDWEEDDFMDEYVQDDPGESLDVHGPVDVHPDFVPLEESEGDAEIVVEKHPFEDVAYQKDVVQETDSEPVEDHDLEYEHESETGPYLQNYNGFGHFVGGQTTHGAKKGVLRLTEGLVRRKNIKPGSLLVLKSGIFHVTALHHDTEKQVVIADCAPSSLDKVIENADFTYKSERIPFDKLQTEDGKIWDLNALDQDQVDQLSDAFRELKEEEADSHFDAVEDQLVDDFEHHAAETDQELDRFTGLREAHAHYVNHIRSHIRSGLASTRARVKARIRQSVAAGDLVGDLDEDQDVDRFLRRFFRKVGSAVKKGWKKFTSAVKKVGKAIWKGIKKIGRAIGKAFVKVGKALRKFGKFIVQMAVKIVKKIFSAIVSLGNMVRIFIQMFKKATIKVHKHIFHLKHSWSGKELFNVTKQFKSGHKQFTFNAVAKLEKAEVSIGPGLTLNGLIVKFRLMHFNGSIWGKAEVLLKAFARISAVGAYHRIKPLFTKSFHKGFKIGPVPVYFRLEFKVSLGMVLRVDGYAQLTMGYSLRYLLEVGAQYKKGKGWKPFFKKELKKKYDPPTLNFCVNAFAEAFLRPQIGLFIFGVVGPIFMLEPYVNFEFKGDGRSHCKGKKVVTPPPKKQESLMKTLGGMASNALAQAGKNALGLTDMDQELQSGTGFQGPGIALRDVDEQNDETFDAFDPIAVQHKHAALFRAYQEAEEDSDTDNEVIREASEGDDTEELLSDAENEERISARTMPTAEQDEEHEGESWGRRRRRWRPRWGRRRRRRRVRRRRIVRRKKHPVRRRARKPRRVRKRRSRRRRRRWGRRRRGRRGWGRRRRGRRSWGRGRRWGHRRRRRARKAKPKPKVLQGPGGRIETKRPKGKPWKLPLLTKIPKSFAKANPKLAGTHPSYWAFRIGIRAIVGFELSFFGKTQASWRKKILDKFKPLLQGCLNLKLRCLKNPPVLPGMDHEAYTGEKLPKWEKKHVDFLLKQYGHKIVAIRKHLVEKFKTNNPQAWKVWENFRKKFDRCDKWKTERKCAGYKTVGQAPVCKPGPKVKTTCKKWTQKKSDKCLKFCDSPCKDVTVPPNPECKRWETEKKCAKYRTEGNAPECKPGEQVRDSCEEWTQRDTTECLRWCDKPCQTVNENYQECAEYTTDRTCPSYRTVGSAPQCSPGPRVQDGCKRWTQKLTTRCLRYCNKECKIVTKWAEVWAEPHLVTLDGHDYTLREAGDFRLLSILNQDDEKKFEIQARSQPVHQNGKRLPGTVFTAAALKLGPDVLEFYANPRAVKLNGKVLKKKHPWSFNGKRLSSGVMLVQNGKHELSIVTPWHGAVMIKWLVAQRKKDRTPFLDINVRLGATVGATAGLLGDNNKIMGDYKPEKRLAELRVMEAGHPAQPGVATIPSLFTVAYHAPKNFLAWSDKELKKYTALRGKLAKKVCGQFKLTGYRLRACEYDVIITGGGDWAQMEDDARRQFYHDVGQFGWGGLNHDMRSVIRQQLLQQHGDSLRRPVTKPVTKEEDSDSDLEQDSDDEEDSADMSKATNWNPPNDGREKVMCRGYANPNNLRVVDCPTTECMGSATPTVDYCRAGQLQYDSQGRAWRLRKYKTQVTECPRAPDDKYCCGGYAKENTSPCLEYNYKDGPQQCTPDTRRQECVNWNTNRRCVRMETKTRTKQVCPSPPNNRECCGGYKKQNVEPCIKWKMKDGEQVCTPDTRKQVCDKWDEKKNCVEKNPPTTKKECPKPPADKYCCGEYQMTDSEPCIEWNYKDGEQVCTPDTRKRVCDKWNSTRKCVGRTGWYHQWKEWYTKHKDQIKLVQKWYVRTDLYLKTKLKITKGSITWNGLTVTTNTTKTTTRTTPKPTPKPGPTKPPRIIPTPLPPFRPTPAPCPTRRVCKCPPKARLRMELLKREARVREMAKAIQKAEENPRLRKVDNVKRKAKNLKSIAAKIEKTVGGKNKYRGGSQLLHAARQYRKESDALLKQALKTEKKERADAKKTMRLAEKKLHLRRAIKQAKNVRQRLKKLGCKCRVIRSCRHKPQWPLKCHAPCPMMKIVALHVRKLLQVKSGSKGTKSTRHGAEKDVKRFLKQWLRYVQHPICKACGAQTGTKKSPLLAAACQAVLKYKRMGAICMRVRRLLMHALKLLRRAPPKWKQEFKGLALQARSVAECLACKKKKPKDKPQTTPKPCPHPKWCDMQAHMKMDIEY